MKASMKINAKIIVEAEGDTPAAVFEGLARLAGVLGAAEKCGCCGGTALLPNVRDAKGYRFFELVCTNPACGARFGFGQLKDIKGGLFPKFRDDQGNVKPDGGWARWEGKKGPPVERQAGDENSIPY